MEKEIIKSNLINFKAIAIRVFVLLESIASIVSFIFLFNDNLYDCASWNWSWDWVVEKYGKNANVFTVTLYDYFSELFFLYIAIGLIFVVLFCLMFFKTELVVTNKRVYGKALFGKRVDLPLDSISAVGTTILKGIVVSTSSGKIKFLGIKNRNEIHDCLSKLLISRQENKPATQTIKQEIPKSEADELKKYKELFDMGVITQEEFDAKKKQLLGL